MWWLVLIVLVFAVPEILSTILESRIGRAIAAQIEGRSGEGGTNALRERVLDLEGEVDRLTQEVHRLREETEFFQRLLTERSEKSEPERPSGGRAP